MLASHAERGEERVVPVFPCLPDGDREHLGQSIHVDCVLIQAARMAVGTRFPVDAKDFPRVLDTSCYPRDLGSFKRPASPLGSR